MRAAFHPFLPNGVTGDPVVWIDRIDDGRALLFDLGDLRSIPNRKLLRVDRALVTHTHLDHFFGFDQLLRVSLTRESELTISGPRGFIDNVRGRIAGYSWNLIESYPIRLRIEEIDGETVRTVLLTGGGRLLPEPLPDRPLDGALIETDTYRVDVARLDHGIPVLAFALREREHLAINKDRLERLGLQPGSWLGELKTAVRAGRDENESIQATAVDGSARSFPLGRLRAELVLRSAGQSLGYVCDLRGTGRNLDRAATLVRDVHLLICEATFLHVDGALARERNHLTAAQAGELARRAGARRLAVFHVSQRYEGREGQLLAEAAEAFGGPVVRLPPGPETPRRDALGPVL